MADIVPFKDQDYESLLSEHDSGNLFEDPLFPCTDKSLYFSQKPPRGVVWKRPKVRFHDRSFIGLAKLFKYTSISGGETKCEIRG